jgi:hypothetical protein
MTDTPKSLCNDLNRLAAINIITLALDQAVYGKKIDMIGWKNGFLRDIGILMVYHQVLARTVERFDDDGMINDLAKTSVLILVPNIKKPQWNYLLGSLALVAVYHKVIRKHLISFLQSKGIGFNEGIEDMVENLLLLSISRDGGISSAISQILSLGIYHAAMKH